MNVLRYFYNSPSDEIPAIEFDDDSDWWAGVQKCAGTVALSATLAVSAFSAQTAQAVANQQQDDPAGALHSFIPDEDYNLRTLFSPHLRVYSSQQDGIFIIQFDEDYWQNPTPPTFPPNYVQLPFVERDDIPVGSIFGQPEEDFWKNPVPPVPASHYVQLPLGDNDDVPAGRLALIVEEQDSGLLPTPKYPWAFSLYMGDEEIVQFRAVTPEEDYWQRRVSIPLQKIYGRSFSGQTAIRIDEDIWQPSMELGNPWRISLWLDDTQAIPITPFNLDEDFWQNPVPSAWAYYNPIAFSDDDVWVPFITPPPPLPFDEEVWFSWVAPVPGYNVVPTFSDDSDWVPNVPFVPLPLDEEPWEQALSVGTQWTYSLWLDDDVVVTLSSFQPDEEVIGISQTFDSPWIVSLWADDDTPSSFAGTITEDDVWLNPVQPVPWTFGKIYAPDQDDVAVTFKGSQDEDFWQNPVLPVPAAQYIQFPYLPDAEEIPAGSLKGQADEDFWQNPAPPVPLTFGRLYAPDLDDIPAGNFEGQKDEDFWVNPVPPVTYNPPYSSYIFPLLYRDLEEIPSGSLFGLAEEMYWQNPTPPVPAKQYVQLPYLPDPDEIPAGNLFMRPDEDFWVSGVQPIAFYAPPKVFLDEDITVPPSVIPVDELYWQNPVQPVAASNYLRFPILPDPEEIPAGSLHPPVPPPIPRPCPCQQFINVPSDQLFDIVLCPVTGGIYLACIATQPNTLLAERMGGPTIMIYVYGSPQQAMGQARAFVLHNLGVQ